MGHGSELDVTRIEELEAKLAKRRNQPGMAENVKQLEEEIARLKAEQNG
jgi:hypothetical protein